MSTQVLPAHARFLGMGVLNWERGERVTDRYGYVHLCQSVDTQEISNRVQLPQALTNQGHYGSLYAHVIETRQSRHIGDLVRGIFPHIPLLNSLICLGTGILDVQQQTTSIGLQPTDSRETDWLRSTGTLLCP